MISALIGIPLLILLIYLGELYLFLTVVILSILGLYEYHRLFKDTAIKNILLLSFIGSLVVPFLFFFSEGQDLIAGIFFLIIISFLYYLVRFPLYTSFSLALTILGILYVSGGFAHLVLLRSLDQGFWLVIYTLVIVWSTDTGAYFIGLSFGKHKLAPQISPQKSWEGFFGGIFFSVVGAYLLFNFVPLTNSRQLIMIAPLVSLGAQLGDLFESSLKRTVKVKDSGNIIPGHGGILDRFDSLLWSAPLTYYLIILLERLSFL